MASHTPTEKQTANLKPFGQDAEGKRLASEAGRKSGEARRKKREQRELSNIVEPDQISHKLDEVLTSFKREELGPSAASAAQYLIGRVISGGIEIPGNAVGGLIETLVGIARLESGLSTSNSVHVSMSSSDALARLENLRAVGGGGVEAEGGTTGACDYVEVLGVECETG